MLRFEQTITSRQNPTVKRICALKEKKERAEKKLFRFDGIKLFDEAVDCGVAIDCVIVREGVGKNITDALERALELGAISERMLICVSESVFEKLSEERSPEGIITVAHFLGNVRTSDAEFCPEKSEKILVAESLRDAGNLGTVIRSCAALGIDRLIISDDCADIYNPKTVRSAMGGLFRLKTDIVSDVPEYIRGLRKCGRRVYAAALRDDAYRIGSLSLLAGDCFVIGNEGHGLSTQTIDACDACAIIPMSAGSESLNAAAAAAICIWETVNAERR